MPGRFLKTFEPVMKVIPEVRAPERKVGFNEKIFWTAMALIIYLVMSYVPLYGLQTTQETSAMRIIFASTKGSLMELGIGPIVTAGLILQMLAGSNFINVDFSNPEDRSLFTGVSKIFSIILTGFQADLFDMGDLQHLAHGSIDCDLHRTDDCRNITNAPRRDGSKGVGNRKRN